MLILKRIQSDDIDAATELAKAAFIDDERFKPLSVKSGGPPGHYNTAVHKKWMEEKLYYICCLEEQLCGSIIIDLDGTHATIHGMQVSPSFMHKGIGSWMLREIRSLYPEVEIWDLETPDYAKRNHRFYEKNGFLRVSTTAPEYDLGFGFWHYQLRTQ